MFNDVNRIDLLEYAVTKRIRKPIQIVDKVDAGKVDAINPNGVRALVSSAAKVENPCHRQEFSGTPKTQPDVNVQDSDSVEIFTDMSHIVNLSL